MILEEIKTLRLHNQHLLGLADVHTVSRDLCGVQAQFLSNAFHALRIRSIALDPSNPKGLIKSWTLRGTMHLFDERDLPLMLHKGRTHFLRPCDTLEADEWVSQERKRFFADLILNAVREGSGERESLKQLCFDAGMTEMEAQSVFNPWGGLIRALCEAGKLTHAVSERKALIPCLPFEPMEKDVAELELARRYFTHYGPASLRDAAYFFGCRQSDVKRWIVALPLRRTVCGGQTYYDIEDSPAQKELPACLFLAGFDPLMLGYEKTENPFLPKEYLRGIFSMAGIVNPALLIDGSVAGKWKRAGKRINVTMFETVSNPMRHRIEESAEQLWSDLKEVRFL